MSKLDQMQEALENVGLIALVIFPLVWFAVDKLG
jgi:hypothetical protein